MSSGRARVVGARFQCYDVVARHVERADAWQLRTKELTIGGGQTVAFIGPSGAGKTTLLRLLAGSLQPTRGTVAIDGFDLGSLSPKSLRAVRTRIGFIHQDHRLVPNLRVYQNVLAGRLGRMSMVAALRHFTYPSRKIVAEIYEILDRVGIPETLYLRTDRLSGGQQQRVAIARALFQEPAALLADEPVASVDPARARDTISLLTRISRDYGMTLGVSLHDVNLARGLFQRLIGLRDGKIVFDRVAGDLTDSDLERLYDLDRRDDRLVTDQAPTLTHA